MDRNGGAAIELETVFVAIDMQSLVAFLTLNRPEAMNAINRRLATDLFAACAFLRDRADVRVVVLNGAGERAFCAGADLKERRLLSVTERAEHTAAIEAAAELLAAMPMPTIAAVHGYALAGGAELAIACDLRVAANDAVFGFPEVKVGIFPGAGGVLRLPGIIGGGAARDLLLTGRQVDAQEALSMGLVDRVVETDALLATANGLAESIGANAPLAVRAVKSALQEIAGRPHAEARRRVNELRVSLDGTADYEEGLLAFAERRPPRFSGR